MRSRLQPLAAVDLVVADNVPHAVRKDLRTAAWASNLTPAAFIRRNVSSMVILLSFAKNATSTIVNALMCTFG